MATEKRLIDANELLQDARRCRPILACLADIVDIEHLVNDQPTVDAVEVVRCKDCKWAEYGKDYEPYCNHWKSGLYANIKDDDFCSYGERRNDEDT